MKKSKRSEKSNTNKNGNDNDINNRIITIIVNHKIELLHSICKRESLNGMAVTLTNINIKIVQSRVINSSSMRKNQKQTNKLATCSRKGDRFNRDSIDE